MKALEARDYITEGHGDRLQDLIEAFAGTVELPVASVADLRLFARFHDIGKVGTPDSILFKAGNLTAEEWVNMRQHCEIGYRIAVSAPDYRLPTGYLNIMNGGTAMVIHWGWPVRPFRLSAGCCLL